MPEKAEAAPIKNLQDSGKIVIFASQLINNKTVNENIRGNKKISKGRMLFRGAWKGARLLVQPGNGKAV